MVAAPVGIIGNYSIFLPPKLQKSHKHTVEAERKRDQENAHARAVFDVTEHKQQYSGNNVRFKDKMDLQIDAD